MIVKNLKFLRKYYGDKQVVLARMLKVSQSTISDYECRKKPIPVDILPKIAKRYNESVDDLINLDLSLKYDVPHTICLNDMTDFGNVMFPIATSNIAKKSDSFNRGRTGFYEALNVDRIEEVFGKMYKFEYAITQFQNAWEEVHTSVALANSITTVLFMFSLYNEKSLGVGQTLIDRNNTTIADLNKMMLCDPRETDYVNPYAKQRTSIFNKYKDLVYENIMLLKSKSQFLELGDYYAALCFVLGFTDEDIDDDTSYMIGVNMIGQLRSFNNKYAVEFLNFFR